MADDSVSSEVHGLQELRQAIEGLFDRVGSQAAGAFEPVAQHVQQLTRNAVPRDSGLMAQSVFVEHTRVGYDGSTEYAGWVDFGGGDWGRDYIPSGRYLFPAVNASLGMLEDGATRMVEQEIGRARWP